MSLTARVSLGLFAGLALGIALASWLPPSWQPLAGWIEPIGTIWTRALQLMVIPLVTTLLFTGVSSGGTGLGRLGAKGIAFFAITLTAMAAFTLLVAPAIFARIRVDPDASLALRSRFARRARRPMTSCPRSGTGWWASCPITWWQRCPRAPCSRSS
jgi:Na+/H+-dicarboxylate symporter